MTDALQRAACADVLLFSLGVLDDESVLVRSGGVTDVELQRLRAANACGDVLGPLPRYRKPDRRQGPRDSRDGTEPR